MAGRVVAALWLEPQGRFAAVSQRGGDLDQEKTFHRMPAPIRGQKIRFENVEQEEPIGELSAYNVTSDAEPQGSARLSYTLRMNAQSNDGSIEAIKNFIDGRYTADERAM